MRADSNQSCTGQSYIFKSYTLTIYYDQLNLTKFSVFNNSDMTSLSTIFTRTTSTSILATGNKTPTNLNRDWCLTNYPTTLINASYPNMTCYGVQTFKIEPPVLN